MPDATPRERPDVASWRVLALVGGFLVFVAAAVGGVHAFYQSVAAQRPRQLPRDFPEPGLQSDPAGDLAAARAVGNAALRGARDLPNARLPIEQAMDRIAARHAAAFDPLVAPAP